MSGSRVLKFNKNGSFEGDISTLYGCNSHPSFLVYIASFWLIKAANSDACMPCILVYKMGLVFFRACAISGLNLCRGVLAVVGEGGTWSWCMQRIWIRNWNR
jgi:hypothetical protein